MQQQDMALKAFLGDLVTGMHQEMVSDGKFSTKDYQEIDQGSIDQYMGSLEYDKLLHSCSILQELLDTDIEMWNKTHSERSVKFFKSTELEHTV